MRENDDLDLLLDSALKTYAESEASPSLEQRILARIAAEPSVAPRPRWHPWAIAVPLAACLLLVVLFMSQKHRALNQIAVTPSATSSSLAVLPAAPHPELAHHTKARSHLKPVRPIQIANNRNVSLPKLDVFPTPQPLTPQEQALTAFAARAPAPKLQALLAAQNQSDAPLSIPHIPALAFGPPDEGNK